MNSRRMRRLFSIVLALFCTAALLAACGGSAPAAPVSDSGQTAGNPGGSESSPAANQQPVTLRWYMRWDKARLDNVATPVIEAFEREHPNIKIEIENVGSGSEYWTKLQTMIAGGTAPDIIYPATHNGYALASKGALRPLDDLIARDGIDVNAYDQQILDLYRYDDKLYGLPLDTASFVVFYNKNMFDEAGVAYPQEGWTWDEFLETAKAVTKDTNNDGRNDVFGIDTWTAYWPVIVWTKTGHAIFDDLRQPTQMLIEDQESIDALQWLADLTNVHGVMPSTAERADISDMFVANKSAMSLIGHWRVPQYMANISDFDWDIAPLPQGKIAANRSDGSSFAITANSKHPEEAWEFIKFLSGPGSLGVETLLDLQQMTPALVEFQQSDRFLKPEALPGKNKAAFLAGKENLFPMYDPIHPIYDEIAAIQNSELDELWNGNVSADEAVTRMKPQIEAALQKVR